jgi:hypothetical protein
MANEYEAKIRGEVHENDPIVNQRGPAFARWTTKGEQVVQLANPEMYALEGAAGVFSNPTPGTAIVSQASITAFDATKDVLHIFNAEAAKYLLIDYIKLFVGTVPGGSGTQKYEFRTDSQTGFTSGGTALTLKRANTDVASPFGNIAVNAGALTTIAGSSNVEKSFSGEMRNGVGLAGDTFLFAFGAPMHMGGFLLPATTVGMQRTLHHGPGPVIVKPGGAFRMSHYGASLSTAAQFEWEIGVRIRTRQPQ